MFKIINKQKKGKKKKTTQKIYEKKEKQVVECGWL